MSSSRRLAAALAAAVLLFTQAAWGDASSELDKGRNAYLAKQYDEARARIEAMLEPGAGAPVEPALIAEARMYLGAVYIAQKQPEKAAAIFERLLSEYPAFEYDPLSFPTDVINALIDTKAKLRDRLEAAKQERARQQQERLRRDEAERKRQAERIRQLEKWASEETVIERHSRWLSLVPFGVGQFQNGQPALGWTFLGAEAVLLGGSLAAIPFYLSARDRAVETSVAHDDFRAKQYVDRANAARTANLALLSALAVTAVVGVLQAEVAYVPDVTRTKKRSIPQRGAVAPTLLPIARDASVTGVSLGLQGSF